MTFGIYFKIGNETLFNNFPFLAFWQKSYPVDRFGRIDRGTEKSWHNAALLNYFQSQEIVVRVSLEFWMKIGRSFSYWKGPSWSRGLYETEVRVSTVYYSFPTEKGCTLIMLVKMLNEWSMGGLFGGYLLFVSSYFNDDWHKSWFSKQWIKINHSIN